jgi:hypothetical protein
MSSCTLFAGLSGGEMIPVILSSVAIGGWMIVSIVKMMTENWRKAKESEHIAILKQQMLDRGMSAEEIAMVVNAGANKPPHMI